jgi:hypothetical protein
MLYRPPHRDEPDDYEVFCDAMEEVDAAQRLFAEKLLALTLLAQKQNRKDPNTKDADCRLKLVSLQVPQYWVVDVTSLVMQQNEEDPDPERVALRNEAVEFLRGLRIEQGRNGCCLRNLGRTDDASTA